MLNICRPRKHYMIEYSNEYAENLRIKFAKKIEEGVVELLEAVNEFAINLYIGHVVE